MGKLPPTTAVGAGSRFWDALCLLLCVLLALAATMFPARNSDLFFHLASGRHLVEGTYSFASDPFLYTTNQTIVNHSWLYSAIFYSIHQLPAGPEILVVLKSLLAACTIGLLAACSRARTGTMTVGILVLGLAAVGMSGRWLLQPFVVSVFLLALILFLTERISLRNPEGILPKWAFVLFPLICLFWVNLDSWFFIGPLVVTLALGQRSPFLALGCWAICLANPWGWNAFQLPLFLRGYQEFYAPFKPLFEPWFAPFGSYYLNTSIGGSITGLAFVPIALVGFILLGRNPLLFRQPLGWLFLFFLAMGLYTNRALPFFCVVGAWVTLRTLNPVDKAGEINGHRLVLPKLGLALFLLIGIGGGLTGWIHSRPREERMLGLGIIPDPSLKSLSLWVKNQKESGNWSPDRNVFHLSVDFSNYLAWFVPGTKGFIDHRLQLTKEAANDYLTCHNALVPRLQNPENARLDSSDWKDIFGRWKVGYLFLQETRSDEMNALIGLLTQNRDLWDVIRVEGTCTALHLRGTDAGELPKAEFPGELAFGSGAKPLPDSRWDPTSTTPWMTALLPNSGRPGPKVSEAHLRLMQFESTAYVAPRNWLISQIASLALNSSLPQSATNPATWNALLGTGIAFAPNSPGELLQRIWNQSTDLGDPAYLWLALRAARENLLVHPNDAKAWLQLGRSYVLINQMTIERTHLRLGDPMSQIRRFQAIHCLSKATLLAQDVSTLQNASQLLAQAYGNQFMDRTLFHMREYRRIQSAFPGAVTVKEHEEALMRIDGNIAMLEKEVSQRQDSFENESRRIEAVRKGASALEKAQMAFQLGLLNIAFEQINSPESREQANLDGTGRIARDTYILNIELLLNLGLADNASTTLSEEMKSQVGYNPTLMISTYNWHQVLVAACQGKYSIAEAYLAESLQQLARERQEIIRTMVKFSLLRAPKDVKNPPTTIEMLSLNLGRHLLNQEQTASGLGPWIGSFWDFSSGENRLTGFDLDEAMNIHFTAESARNILGELNSCRAFLLLEAGHPTESKQLWNQALKESPEMGSHWVVKTFLSKLP